MTITDTTTTEALTESWTRLCDEFSAFGRVAIDTADPLDRAEGLRHILRFLGHLADRELEHNDPLRPEFWRITGPKRKFYGDGVDVDYDSATIHPDQHYRITGTRGTVPYLEFLVNRRGSANRLAGNVVVEPEHLRPDGTFEVHLSKDLQDRWGIELDDACCEVIARQYHFDRDAEVDATYEIEVVGEDVPPRSPLTEDFLLEGLQRLALGLSVSARRLDGLCAGLSETPNQFDDFGASDVNKFFGTPSNVYRAGWFDLDEDEHLHLEIPIVPARYIGIQLFNRWFESLEFRDHVTSLNKMELVLRDDGIAPITIGGPPRDRNWLDTCGHRSGIFLVRYLLPDQPVGAERATLRRQGSPDV